MTDPVVTYFLLCGSALLAGAINSVAGGGTLLTFPALMAALGGNGVLANGTSTVALAPGSLAGAWGYRKELADKRGLILRLLLPSLVGGAAGALLVTRLPPSIFNALVPWLILTAALLFAFQKPLQRWVGAHHAAPGRHDVGVIVFQFFVGLYGGYFGAGIGILMLTALGFLAVGDIHHMNGVKTVLATAINGIAIVIFVVDRQVRWDFALAMMAAAIVGGYAGARVARRLPAAVVRGIVVAIGLILAGYYFWQQFGR
jgi:uncharacterized membrane protein YfcA